MNKIEKIETFILEEKLSQSFYFSQWDYSERRTCIVKVTTSDGEFGWGEGYGPANLINEGIAFLKPFVLGKNPLENEVIWHNMYRKTLDFARRGILVSALSAIDVALWDLKGKLLGLPVSTLLGGAHRTKIKPYATGLYFTDPKNPRKNFEKEIGKYLAMGFKAIKMKVGLGINEDFDNVKYVRSLIGDDIELMVDSNHAYSLREAVILSKKLESLNISWFEEPLSPEFYKQYSELRNKTSIPIAGGECEYLRYGFHQMLRNNSVDIIQPDICACGGITEAKRISALTTTYGVDLVPHTWGSAIGLHTALHFISNLENMPGRMKEPDFFMEYDQTENSLREKLTNTKIELVDGYIEVPNTPGLGIEINQEVLNKFTVKKQKHNGIIS
ncbi:mandelate racemase/muconate lactonizing enzyme family protein [Flavobacteriaceae bacterium]|nr:mandelate racemase/muconate lactonizing enzyme family protein [Flavobacteriaceae bacterium]